MSDEITIYALCDPDGSVRYVGQALNPEQRFARHTSQTKPSSRPVDKWIAGLLASGMKPKWKELERVPVERAYSAERYWVRRLFAEGCILTNANLTPIGSVLIEPEWKTRTMRKFEQETGKDLAIVIQEALDRGDSNARVAADLGVSVTTLYNWMRTLGLTVERRAVVHGPGE